MPEAADADEPPDGVSAGQPAAMPHEPSPALRVGRAALALSGVVVAYYAIPVGEVPSSWDIVFASARAAGRHRRPGAGSRCASSA